MEGQMYQAVIKLENIMKLEREIYQDIFHIEEEKSDAIIKKAGKEIEELSLKQEKLLGKVESLEIERLKLMVAYKKQHNSRIHGREITLQDIIDSSDNKSASALKNAGVELKKILLKVKKIQDMNSQLLKDNMEFYDILISGLKNSSTLRSGYGRDGKEKGRVFNPVLFNIKA
jgi:hypothetical protein